MLKSKGRAVYCIKKLRYSWATTADDRNKSRGCRSLLFEWNEKIKKSEEKSVLMPLFFYFFFFFFKNRIQEYQDEKRKKIITKTYAPDTRDGLPVVVCRYWSSNGCHTCLRCYLNESMWKKKI